MQKRKGFTIVELVVVIAVIAILAGVMIGTFASVINRANESVKMQEMKAQEIEQKANDVIEKLNNKSWLGWDDFEASVVEKMTQVYKANASAGSTVSADDIKVAVKQALKEYTDSQANGNTGLTEEQVRTIIENAIGKIDYSGVTEAQVKAIVTQAVSAGTASQLTAAQVKSIVNAAAANNLTVTDVSNIISSLGLATSTKVDAAVTQITTALETATAGALSIEDLDAAIINLLPVTYKISSAADLEKALASVNSFSTLAFAKDYGPVALKVTDNRTLTITGVALEDLTVDAPLATIYLSTDAGTVKVNSVAENSFHVSGTVESLEIKQGRVVVENAGVVTLLSATPAKDSLVIVKVAEQAKVTSLEVVIQKNTTATATAHETITIENDGQVEGLTVKATGDGTVSTNVVVINGTTSSGTKAETIAETAKTASVNVKVKDSKEKVEYSVSNSTIDTSTIVETSATLDGAGTTADPYVIRTVEELQLAAKEAGGVFSLVKDIDALEVTWDPFEITSDFTFDGNGHRIVGVSNCATYTYSGTEIVNLSGNASGTSFGFVNNASAAVVVKNLTLENINIDMKDTGIYCAGVVAIADSKATINIDNVVVSGEIKAKDKAAGFIGASAALTPTQYAPVAFTISNSTNKANVTVYNPDSYSRGGGFVSQLSGNGTFNNCKNEGNINITGKSKTNVVYAGPIVSQYNESASVIYTGCTNSGKISITVLDGSEEYYAEWIKTADNKGTTAYYDATNTLTCSDVIGGTVTYK